MQEADMDKHKYGLFVRTDCDYDEAVTATKAALKAEGFGVLTEIDVKSTMKEKLGADFRRYDIIGACNPPLAHAALTAERDIGLLLPCNVIVYEEDGGGSVVAALDPQEMMDVAGNPGLRAVASEARARLGRALAVVEARGR
jgi:uncharacterized protein (DUF302 family)